MTFFQQQVIKENPTNETIGFLCVELGVDPGIARWRGTVKSMRLLSAAIFFMTELGEGPLGHVGPLSPSSRSAIDLKVYNAYISGDASDIDKTQCGVMSYQNQTRH